MAVKPKTLNQAQALYSTNSELAWWVFMRVSGLILIFLVAGHIWMGNIQINVADVDYAYVANRLSKGWVKVYDTFLLFFAMLHGVNGLRYNIEDYFKQPGRRFWGKIILFTIAGILFVMGTMTLWAFDFSEMGDAVRSLDGGSH